MFKPSVGTTLADGTTTSAVQNRVLHEVVSAANAIIKNFFMG